MPPLKTDDEILNSIPGMNDTDVDTGDDNGAADVTTEAAATTTTQPGNTGDNGASAATGSGSGSADGTAAQGDKQQQQQPTKPQAKDARGPADLVDPKTGQVIAKGGAERRYYEDAQRYRREADRARTELTTAQSRVRELEAATSIAKELGLNATQQIAAMRTMADLMKDPVTTLKAIITEVRAAGVNLDDLFQNASGIDMAAINKTIDTKLQPVLKPQQEQQQRQQVEADAQRTLDDFLDKHQDAAHNLDVISSIMRETGSDLPSAYIEMVKWASRNGYDPTQPLMQQMHDRTAQENGQQQQPQSVQPNTQTTTPQPSKPLPNGRTAVADTSANGSVADVEDNTVYNEAASWRNILRREMMAGGFNLPD